MKVVGSTIGMLLKRPFIMIFFGIIMMGYLIIDRLNPTFTIIYGLTTMGKSDILGSLVALLQLLIQPGIITKGLLILGAFILGASLFAGLVLSGFFNTLSSYVEKGAKTKGSFKKGVSGYFAKIFIATFIVLTGGILLSLVLMVASVPAIVVTKAATGKAGFILVAALLDMITIGAVFFGLMFFRIYMIFWYPAIFNGNQAFRSGKRIVDPNFWSILFRMFMLDIIFIASELIFIQPNESLLFFIANWVFKTIFFSFYTTYFFQLFKFLKKTKQDYPKGNPAS